MPFNIGITGLTAANTDLKVLSNNLANVKTVGFKYSRAEFGDIFASSQFGSTNVGSGVRLSDVAQQFTQGQLEFTGNSLDMAVSGNGFFQVQDSRGVFYTRNGEFKVDSEGFVVNNQGMFLVAVPPEGGNAANLQIDTAPLSPRATGVTAADPNGGIQIEANLDAQQTPITIPFDPNIPDSYSHSTTLTVFDSLGNPLLATMYYVKTADNTWESHVTVATNVDNNGDGINDIVELPPSSNTTPTLSFDNTGTLTNDPARVEYDAAVIGGGANDLNITIDYGTNFSQFSAPFSVSDLKQNGYSTGQLVGLEINTEGDVNARYSNGEIKSFGQIQLTSFSNPQGLTPSGNNLWTESSSSGEPVRGTPGTGTLGTIEAGAVEQSNVDLTIQLVKLITAQRNFQANAQVISAGDTISQTIINL